MWHLGRFSEGNNKGNINETQRINDMFKYYQHKHQIYSLEDLERSKFKTSSRPPRSNRERDPSDLIGNWEQQKMEMGMYITVDTDQTAPTMGSMSAMDPAEGGIIISNDEFTTELNYLSFGDFQLKVH